MEARYPGTSSGLRPSPPMISAIIPSPSPTLAASLSCYHPNIFIVQKSRETT
jgi:hypothetical protein